MSDISIDVIATEEIEKYYDGLNSSEKVVQFLINSLICSAYGLIDAETAIGFIMGLSKHGPPNFQVYEKVAALASKKLEQDFAIEVKDYN